MVIHLDLCDCLNAARRFPSMPARISANLFIDLRSPKTCAGNMNAT
jgi:hypothetical protein